MQNSFDRIPAEQKNRQVLSKALEVLRSGDKWPSYILDRDISETARVWMERYKKGEIDISLNIDQVRRLALVRRGLRKGGRGDDDMSLDIPDDYYPGWSPEELEELADQAERKLKASESRMRADRLRVDLESKKLSEELETVLHGWPGLEDMSPEMRIQVMRKAVETMASKFPRVKT
jgi:hypothetical protein